MTEDSNAVKEREARRDFFVRCDRFAAVMLPLMSPPPIVSSVRREDAASTIGRRRRRGGSLIDDAIGLLG